MIDEALHVQYKRRVLDKIQHIASHSVDSYILDRHTDLVLNNVGESLHFHLMTRIWSENLEYMLHPKERFYTPKARPFYWHDRVPKGFVSMFLHWALNFVPFSGHLKRLCVNYISVPAGVVGNISQKPIEFFPHIVNFKACFPDYVPPMRDEDNRCVIMSVEDRRPHPSRQLPPRFTEDEMTLVANGLMSIVNPSLHGKVDDIMRKVKHYLQTFR